MKQIKFYFKAFIVIIFSNEFQQFEKEFYVVVQKNSFKAVKGSSHQEKIFSLL